MRIQIAVYAAGMFANSASNMLAVIVPLWLILLGHPPALIGLVIGARSILPLFLAIHGGALMDRLGTRQVMIYFSAVAAVTPLLYPMSVWTWALFGLQMIAGWSTTICWMGAQTLIGQLMKGSAVYAGRLTFATRIGTLSGPPLVGIAWDLAGHWAAFLVLAGWSGLGWIACVMLPQVTQPRREAQSPATWRDFVPRLADYKETFLLLATPAIAIIVFASMMGVAGNGIQISFYVVYLDGIGFNATAIGLLQAATSLLALIGALVAGRFARRYDPLTLLVVTTVGEILAITVTPFFSSAYPLMLLAAFRGLSGGMAHPLTVANLGRGAEANAQGKAVGLRTTANRFTALITPVIMGLVVESAGLEPSFFIVGGTAIAVLVAVWLLIRRAPSLKGAPR